MVIKVTHAVAMGSGAQAGLEMLLRLEGQADGFYPYHAARADLLRRTNRIETAADACKRALVLCQNPVEHTYLQWWLDEMLNL